MSYQWENAKNLTIFVSVAYNSSDKVGAVGYYIKHARFAVKGEELILGVEDYGVANYKGIAIALKRAQIEKRERQIDRLWITNPVRVARNTVEAQIGDESAELYPYLKDYQEIKFNSIDTDCDSVAPRLFIFNKCTERAIKKMQEAYKVSASN